MGNAGHFIIKFTYMYPKLHNIIFTTVRRYDKPEWFVGNTGTCKCPEGSFPAKINAKEDKKLRDMSDQFLTEDTGVHNRENAIKLLNSFYVKPIGPDEILTVLTLERSI